MEIAERRQIETVCLLYLPFPYLWSASPCASCLAFLMNEKSFFDTNPELFPAVSFPSSLRPSMFWRIRVVSAGSFRPGSFRPNFGVSRFSLIWRVDSAVSRFGRASFRPMWGGGYSTYVSSIYCFPNKNIRNIRYSQINI